VSNSHVFQHSFPPGGLEHKIAKSRVEKRTITPQKSHTHRVWWAWSGHRFPQDAWARPTWRRERPAESPSPTAVRTPEARGRRAASRARATPQERRRETGTGAGAAPLRGREDQAWLPCRGRGGRDSFVRGSWDASRSRAAGWLLSS